VLHTRQKCKSWSVAFQHFSCDVRRKVINGRVIPAIEIDHQSLIRNPWFTLGNRAMPGIPVPNDHRNPRRLEGNEVARIGCFCVCGRTAELVTFREQSRSRRFSPVIICQCPRGVRPPEHRPDRELCSLSDSDPRAEEDIRCQGPSRSSTK